jgi:hypothetical protein
VKSVSASGPVVNLRWVKRLRVTEDFIPPCKYPVVQHILGIYQLIDARDVFSTLTLCYPTNTHVL